MCVSGNRCRLQNVYPHLHNPTIDDAFLLHPEKEHLFFFRFLSFVGGEDFDTTDGFGGVVADSACVCGVVSVCDGLSGEGGGGGVFGIINNIG